MTDEEIVTALLAAGGISPSAPEIGDLVSDYRRALGHDRQQIDHRFDVEPGVNDLWAIDWPLSDGIGDLTEGTTLSRGLDEHPTRVVTAQPVAHAPRIFTRRFCLLSSAGDLCALR